MTITLASAALNTTDALDLATIDEFRKSSYLLNALPFRDIVAPTGGATLTHGYTRVITERGAAFRKENTEYTPAEAVRQRYFVDLVPLGGAYQIDRVLANLGPAASDEIAFQTSQLVKSTVARFHDEFINGVAVDFSGGTGGTGTPGFDGLDAAVTGTVTESELYDGSDISDKTKALKAKAALTKWLRTMDGTPTAIFGNEDGIAWLEAVADMIGFYNETKDQFGSTVQTFRGIPFVDLREKSGSADPIIETDSDGVTSLYAAQLSEDGVYGVTTVGSNLVKNWSPDFTTAGAVKKGEVEMGPVGLAVKRTRSAGAFRLSLEALTGGED